MFLKFSLREHAPRLPSLTCLAHAVDHHMKEIIFHLNITSDKKYSVHDYDFHGWPDHSKYLQSKLC